MTLCIAVKCHDAGQPRAVCCFDGLVGNEYETSETAYKWSPIAPGISGMFSGALVPALDLILAYRRDLASAVLTLDNYRDVLWKPMREFSDANVARDYQQEEVEVQLLIVALVEGKFRIVSLNSHGIREHPYFGAIGTGEDSAISSLRWRKPTDETDLHAALYFAYEAKRMGEVSPFVGKESTYINVLTPLDSESVLFGVVSIDGISELKEAFSRFGPQPFDQRWRLSKGSLIL